MFHYPVIRFVLYEFCSEILSVAFMKWLLCSFTCVVFTEPSFVYSSYKSGQYKDIGQVFGKVQHVRDQLLYVTVTGSCSKYLTVFTMSLWEEVKGFHWEICVLFAEVSVCVCVEERSVLSVGERAESWLMGKGTLPAGSICPRVRHQTFTSTHQLFSALHCQSVSMPQWQMTNLDEGRERKGNWRTGIGEKKKGGSVKEETDNLSDAGLNCEPSEWRHYRKV